MKKLIFSLIVALGGGHLFSKPNQLILLMKTTLRLIDLVVLEHQLYHGRLM